MNRKSNLYIIFAILTAFLIACDGGGESSDTGGGVVIDDSASGQDTGGNPPGGSPAPPGSLNDFQAFMLNIVNQARAQSRNCGNQFFTAVPPLQWDERIETAAQMHSEDMAATQIVSHTGSDGSDAGDRLLMENYDWFTWGENILFGLNNGQDAMDALLDSASHCSLIMSPDFQEVGAGSAQGSLQGSSSTYWVIVFATEAN